MVAQTTMQPPESGLFSGPDEKKRERVICVQTLLFTTNNLTSATEISNNYCIIGWCDCSCLSVGWLVCPSDGRFVINFLNGSIDAHCHALFFPDWLIYAG